MPSSRRSSRRPWAQPHPELDVHRATGGRRSEDGPDGTWTVQHVRGAAKVYRCPGCQAMVGSGTPHVVAWQDGLFGRRPGGRGPAALAHRVLGAARPTPSAVSARGAR